MRATHPIQKGAGVIIILLVVHVAVVHACSQRAAHFARVEVEAVAWVLQAQQREQPVGVKLTAKQHIHTSVRAIHTIQQVLGDDEVDRNPAGEAPLVVTNLAVADPMQQLMKRSHIVLYMAC